MDPPKQPEKDKSNKADTEKNPCRIKIEDKSTLL